MILDFFHALKDDFQNLKLQINCKNKSTNYHYSSANGKILIHFYNFSITIY